MRSKLMLSLLFALICSTQALATASGTCIGVLSTPGDVSYGIRIIAKVGQVIHVGDELKTEVLQYGGGLPMGTVIGKTTVFLAATSYNFLQFSNAENSVSVSVDRKKSSSVAPFTYNTSVAVYIGSKVISSKDLHFTAMMINPAQASANTVGVLGTLSPCSIELSPEHD